ncbi:cilia- and flagella-associated protein 100-like [Gambusia affinis]|uniref:cilia- and flagella-associated protein 100-like n=1 Tax=Gambusia affinis TaxID=33528 RepID=UPI001CDD4449|nr:cilia- and flagella-associated protein 100-like [Gambusia affinis]XP_043983341.1 cilia- and flagella-associated protein 100-like [Gambusia affinis]XP_043983342.1 cilia- and flagella-associated protein 100-like [Gambusia affinis]XP_043983343.1 cilia- and flagella-associated protein 100-like [Gambusia affinis]
MSSPHPSVGADRALVSEADVAAKLQKAEMRRRAQQSPYKVPNNKTVFALSSEETENRREEMRKFLALPIEEKATHAARAQAKLKNELMGVLEEEEEEEDGEEENEKKKSLKQIRSKAAFPKETSRTHELKITTAKGEKLTKESRHELLLMERQQAVLELSLMTKRSEILKMEKAVAKEERKLKQLEKLIEMDNQKFEAFLRENERKSVEARALFEREEKSKQEKNAAIKELTDEMRTIQSELEKYEDALTGYLKYKDFLFRLSPAEWQDEQKSKDSKTKTSSEQSDGQEPTETGLERKFPPVTATREKTCSLDYDSLEDKPELYFTDPQQLLDLMSELTEQNLSLIQNSATTGEALAKLRQTVDTTRRKIENKEEKIALQIKELNQKLDKEKARGAKLEQMVQLHVSLSSQDQDEMLDALDKKVTEVYSGCVENRITDLKTLQKVAKIESRVFSLLQSLEGMPVERLAVVKKVKDSEKRSRMREEKLMEQREKQKERMRKYLERSLADSKKISGKKLMPRCMPAVKKVEVADVDNKPAEDDINDYLFGLDDTE